MLVDIITIFPELISSYANESILKRAQERNLAKINAINLRDFSTDKFRHVDDTTYGGGAGMIFKCEPCFKALDACISGSEKPRVIYPSPCGRVFDQNYAKELSKEEHLIILCGRYEGIDQRIIDKYVTDEISIGDYIICGGELASLCICDAVIRLLPKVLGNENSSEDESFSRGLLEYPQYTKPEVFENLRVPEILLSGNHQEIDKWRRKEQIKRTFLRRPDILKDADLDKKDLEYLQKIKSEGEK